MPIIVVNIQLTNKEMMIMNCFCSVADRRKTLALFSTGTIVRDPHHRKSLACHEQDFDLSRT